MSEFRCGLCHHLYVKGLPDPDPEAVNRDSMPGFTANECHLLCDDCWAAAAARIEAAATIVRAAEARLRRAHNVALSQPRQFRAGNPYHDPACPVRPCDHCGAAYTGPALYCSMLCAISDA